MPVVAVQVSALASPRIRLALGYTAGAVVSSIWYLAMFQVVSETPHPENTSVGNWMRNCLVQAVFHPSLMSVAVGLFAASFDMAIIRSLWGKRNYFILLSLIPLLAVATLLVFEDASSPLEPIMLADRDQRIEALRLEAALRRQTVLPANHAERWTPARLSEAQERYRGHLTGARHGTVSFASQFATFFFAYTIMLVFWFGLCVASERRILSKPRLDSFYNRLFTVYGLFLLWFPFRLCASWYANNFWRPDWLNQYAGFWAAGLAALFFFVILYVLKRPDIRPTTLTSLGGGVLLILFGLVKLAPEALEAAADIAASTLSQSTGLWLALLLAMVLVGLFIGNDALAL